MRRVPVVLRRHRRGWLAFAVLVVAATLAMGSYGGYVVVHARRPVALPEPDGPFAVGRVITQWTDRTRHDDLAPTAPDAARRLAVWIWYPSTAATDAPAPYTPGAWRGLQLPFPIGLGQSAFAVVRPHATTSAPPATSAFPVVVLEPGLGLAAPQYTALAESIASHGYVVVAPTPTYSANLTVIDGRVITSSEAGNPPALDAADVHAGAARRAADRLLKVWVADAHFAAAAVRSASSQPFSGHVVADRTVYIGHSFGGAASLEACRTDRSCAAAIDLDGTQFGDVVEAGLDRPLLVIASDAGCVAGTCSPRTAGERADRQTAATLLRASARESWCFTISAAGHFDFSDYDAYYLAAPVRHIVPVGHLPRSRVLRLTAVLVSDFLDEAVHGRTSRLRDAGRQLPDLTLVHGPR